MLENPLRAALAETAARRQSAGLAPGPVWSALRRLTVAELLRPGGGGAPPPGGGGGGGGGGPPRGRRTAATRLVLCRMGRSPLPGCTRQSADSGNLCRAARGAGAARRARRAAGRNPPRRCAAVVPGRRARARNAGALGQACTGGRRYRGIRRGGGVHGCGPAAGFDWLRAGCRAGCRTAVGPVFGAVPVFGTLGRRAGRLKPALRQK